jgi:hypothetical protein
MSHQHDIFYKVSDLSLIEKSDIINCAKSKPTAWWVDKLDCAESWARQRVDMSFNEIMQKFGNSCHFTIIHRRGYEKKGEIGFSTMGLGVDYFLWIEISEDFLEDIIKKFELEINE